MKNLTKALLSLCTVFLFFSQTAFSQANRLINTDSVFYYNSQWNTKNDSGYFLPIDSTTLIIRFNVGQNRNSIISFLQNNQMELIDSLYDFKLCKLNSAYTFNRSLDSMNSVVFFSYYKINGVGELDSDPDDPNYGDQYHLLDNESYANLNIHDAWTKVKGNSRVTVAVIDAYPDWSHEDLANLSDIGPGYTIDNIWENPGEDPWTNKANPGTGNGIDDDNNGFIDDWKGWNFRANSNDTRPLTSYNAHGTNVAGVIAAKSNNGIGVTGIAGGDYSNSPNKGVQILPINIFSHATIGDGNTTTEWELALAIQYASKMRVNIIALSLSFPGANFTSELLDKAIEEAKITYGCMFFSSAGNNGDNVLNYPANNPNVYGVGGLSLSGSSNDFQIGDYAGGKKLDFVALGYNVATTSPYNDYDLTFGMTSAASPQGSGVAALLMSYAPCLPEHLIYEAMKLSAKKDILADPTLATYIYDNNTNSNEYGYGLINASGAIDKIDEWEVSDYSIGANTTWSTTKIANEDVVVESGYTLTITGSLIVSENKKIIVQPGGNLVVNGGSITGMCGWGGIKVYGLPNSSQNTTTFGEVQIINGAELSNAIVAVESIDGGIIISNTGAKYKNNRSAIVINKHLYNNVYTVIDESHFISDGPFTSSTNKANAKIEGIHEFINLNGTRDISILNSLFENTTDIRFTQTSTAINAYSSNETVISSCEFIGMFRAINIVGYNGMLNKTYVISSTFTENLQGIRAVNTEVVISDNTFSMPFVSYKFSSLFASYSSFAVYTFSTINKIEFNTITSVEPTGQSMGIVVRNSRPTNDSYVRENVFTDLAIGTQIEQYNKRLQISCNDYTNINKYAWSVNPQFTSGVDIFPMQGSILEGTDQVRAGNLFYDRGLPSNSLRHIRSSFEFVYNAADFPVESVPEYTSTEVFVGTFDENNSSTCPGDEFVGVLCGEAPCSYEELLGLLAITEDLDSVIRIKKAIIDALIYDNDLGTAIDFLSEWNTDQKQLEYLFESLLSMNATDAASDVLSLYYTVADERDQDYLDLYSIFLNQLIENIPSDSLTGPQFDLVMDIANRTNDVSDLAKAYLNYFGFTDYPMAPEEWSGESLRLTKKPNENSITKNGNKRVMFNMNVFPNPAVDQLNVSIQSEGVEQIYTLEIISPLGATFFHLEMLKGNTTYQLNTSTIPPGMYFVYVRDAHGGKKVKRISIQR